MKIKLSLVQRRQLYKHNTSPKQTVLPRLIKKEISPKDRVFREDTPVFILLNMEAIDIGIRIV